MKKKIVSIILIIVVLILILGTALYFIDMNRIKNNKPVVFSTWGYDYTPPINIDPDKIEETIENYILNMDNTSPRYENEKQFMAMKIYLVEEKTEEKLNVYAWILEESYYKQGEELLVNTGSSIPYKFEISKKDNNYEVADYRIPRDGSYYTEDMKDMFPKDVYNQISKVHSDGTIDELNASIKKQVNEYFNKADNEEYPSFYGKVIESAANYIIVEPNEDEEIRKSSDKISIGLDENNDALYMKATNIKVTYTGVVRETYPAQIDAIKIEIKSVDDFEIKFYDKQPQGSPLKKEITKVNKGLNEKEGTYSVYSYGGSVNIVIDGEEISLKEALDNNRITMDEIIQKANKDLDEEKITGGMYKDGGSMEYHYEYHTIIKKHSLDGNRDVYIGAPDMTLNIVDYLIKY